MPWSMKSFIAHVSTEMCEKNTFRNNIAMDLGFRLFVTVKDTFVENCIYLLSGIVSGNNLGILVFLAKISHV